MYLAVIIVLLLALGIQVYHIYSLAKEREELTLNRYALEKERDRLEEELNNVNSTEYVEQQARERIALQQQRTASMEIPARDLYDIYVRMAQQQKRDPLPVSLEEIWQVLCESDYLQQVGCTVSTDGNDQVIAVF